MVRRRRGAVRARRGDGEGPALARPPHSPAVAETVLGQRRSQRLARTHRGQERHPARYFRADYELLHRPQILGPRERGQARANLQQRDGKKFSRQLPGRFHWVGRNLPKEKADPLEAEKIPGLYTLSEKQRIYPHESLAFHVLGFCDIDEYGQAGIELAWNHILYSPPRTRFLTRDSKGKTMDIMGGKSGIVKDTAGSIKLTIDSRIQQILEWRLSDGAKAVNAGWAAGVCVDPYSGEIVALASYPTLNPNDRKNLSNTDAVRNNALGRVFEPGSIFKPITMSIALETGATSRSTTYKCKGTMKLFDKTMSDVNKRAHGVQISNRCL